MDPHQQGATENLYHAEESVTGTEKLQDIMDERLAVFDKSPRGLDLVENFEERDEHDSRGDPLLPASLSENYRNSNNEQNGEEIAPSSTAREWFTVDGDAGSGGGRRLQRRKQWNIASQVDIPALTSYSGMISMDMMDNEHNELFPSSTSGMAHRPQLRGNARQKPVPASLSGQNAATQHREYLAQLEQRNREKRKQMELDDRQKQLRERERGFNLYMGGANKDFAEDRAKKDRMRRNQKFSHSSSRQSRAQSPWTEGDDISRVLSPEVVTPSKKFQQRRKEWKKDRAPHIKGASLHEEELLLFVTNESHEGNSDNQKEEQNVFDEIFGTSTLINVEDRVKQHPSNEDPDDELDDITPIQSAEPMEMRISARNREGKSRMLGGLDLNQNDIAFLRQSLTQIRSSDKSAPSQNSSPSSSSFLDQIIKKMSRLERVKQEKLLSFLDHLESESKDESVEELERPPEDTIVDERVFFSNTGKTTPPTQLNKHPSNTENLETAPEDTPKDTNGSRERQEWITLGLRFVSTWGHDRTVGLTEIEIYGGRGQKISVVEEDISVKGGIGGSDSRIMHLFNGKTRTTNESNMWQTVLPSLTFLELELRIANTDGLSALRIWNFNKSINESVKGVKDLEVLVDGESVWVGQIQRGCGNNVLDYSTYIQIRPPSTKSIVDVDTVKDASISDMAKHHSVSEIQPLEIDDSHNNKNTEQTGLHPSKSQNISHFQHEESQKIFDENNDQTAKDLLWLNAGTTGSGDLSPHILPNSDQQEIILKRGRIIQTNSIPNEETVGKNEVEEEEEEEDLKANLDYSQTLLDQARARRKHRPSSKNSARSRAATAKESKTEEEMDAFVDPLALFKKQGEVPVDTQSRSRDQTMQHTVPIANTIQRHRSFPELPTQLQQPISTEGHAPAFEIPLHPRGRHLTINILTTWGDPHYVGLRGIEIFDSHGEPIVIHDPKRQIRANPADINVLPQYKDDPRTVDNLFDGHNRTCDDTHMWLAPFTTNSNHFIYIDLGDTSVLGMVRFWNYYKSRIHSFRGARDIRMKLDDKNIFMGEIQRANGAMWNDDEQVGVECIYFTMDDNTLDKIDEYDELQNKASQAKVETIDNNVMQSHTRIRPSTASGHRDEDVSMRGSFNPEVHFNKLDPSDRPMTTAANQLRRNPSQETIQTRPKHAVVSSGNKRTMRAAHRIAVIKNMPTHNASSSDTCGIEGRVVTIHFLSSWGDAYYVGLTGLEILDTELQPIKLTTSMLSAVPRDMNAISGHKGDYRTLDKIIDGVNLTTDDRHMWLIPLTLNKDPHLKIDLGQHQSIRGIRFYNYNKSLDDSFRGCKFARISIDDQLISPKEGHMVRKAPGSANFDFGHTLALSIETGIQTARLGWSIFQNNIRDAIQRAKASTIGTPRQDYETSLLPAAYVFKFQFNSTFGDMYYLGLNGLELYDASHNAIPLTESHMHAVPGSIADEIPEYRDDPRTLDKLIDGVLDVHDGTHSWLALFTPSQPNYLYIVFDEPVALSMIKIWNYSKSLQRGVQEMEVHADDVLIYKGFLRQAQGNAQTGSDYVQSILFTNDTQVCSREKKNIYTHSAQGQDILLWNNGLGSPISTHHPQHNKDHQSSIQRQHPSVSRPHTSLVPK